MFHLPKINKILALPTGVILATLVGSLKLAGWYIKHNFYNSGKGSSTAYPEAIIYVPTIVLTLTLLLLLLFRHWLWHIPFFIALAAQAVVIYWLVDLNHAVSGPPPSWPTSLLEYLDYLPFLMLFSVITIYINYIIYNKSKQ
ncbi:MAG: hypothetical protein ACRYG7_14665 [Janthinobacterium lividum]